MSLPTTPHRALGLSPRGSFVNVADAAEPGSPLLRDDKARMRAETEIKEYRARQDRAEDEKKVDAVSSGSPGEFPSTSEVTSRLMGIVKHYRYCHIVWLLS